MNTPLTRKLLILLIIISYPALQPLPAKAQDTLAVSVNEHLAGVQAERLSRELSLSESQTKEVYKIYLDRIETMGKSHSEKQLTDDKARRINEASLKKLKAILTADQRKLYTMLSSELAEQKKAHYGDQKLVEETFQERIFNF